MSKSFEKLTVYQAQHQGSRDYQEDALGGASLGDVDLMDKKGYLAVIADGMGGLSNGSMASQAAVEQFLKEHRQRQPDEAAVLFLQRALRIANISVFDKAFQDGQEVEMGTMLVAALIEDGRLYWISVGDSSVYHYREGRLRQLNTEHVYGNQLMMKVKNGEISEEEANSHPERAYLTSYLGLADVPEVDANHDPLPLKSGDQVILCSDGLSGVLSQEEMTSIINQCHHDPATEMVQQVLAKKKRHQDNVTVMIIECE